MNEIFKILQEFNPEIKEDRAVKVLQEQTTINPDLYKKISSKASGVRDLSKIKDSIIDTLHLF